MGIILLYKYNIFVNLFLQNVKNYYLAQNVIITRYKITEHTRH